MRLQSFFAVLTAISCAGILSACSDQGNAKISEFSAELNESVIRIDVRADAEKLRSPIYARLSGASDSRSVALERNSSDRAKWSASVDADDWIPLVGPGCELEVTLRCPSAVDGCQFEETVSDASDGTDGSSQAVPRDVRTINIEYVREDFTTCPAPKGDGPTLTTGGFELRFDEGDGGLTIPSNGCVWVAGELEFVESSGDEADPPPTDNDCTDADDGADVDGGTDADDGSASQPPPFSILSISVGPFPAESLAGNFRRFRVPVDGRFLAEGDSSGQLDDLNAFVEWSNSVGEKGIIKVSCALQVGLGGARENATACQ